MASKIQWTDETWNPVVGCTKVSPGCDHCYAERMAYRLACMGQDKYGKVVKGKHPLPAKCKPQWNGKTFCDEKALEIPLHWRKSRMIFVCSMSDLFHPSVPFEFIDKVWDVMLQCQNIDKKNKTWLYRKQHTFQILTKRPERLLEFEQWKLKKGELINYPNVWLGVTAENQEQWDIRKKAFLQIPAAVHFISQEPCLGKIKYTRQELAKVDQIIVGGESGPGARPMHPDWARNTRDRCKVMGVPFFFKQWGAWGVWEVKEKQPTLIGASEPLPRNTTIRIFPEHYNSTIPCTGWAKVGKKKSGRLLDGKEYSEYP